jgi:hypothetical protein
MAKLTIEIPDHLIPSFETSGYNIIQSSKHAVPLMRGIRTESILVEISLNELENSELDLIIANVFAAKFRTKMSPFVFPIGEYMEDDDITNGIDEIKAFNISPTKEECIADFNKSIISEVE